MAAIKASQPGCEVHQESRISLAGLRLSAVKALVRMAGESEGTEILSHMSRVEVVTYTVNPASNCGDRPSLDSFEEDMATRGWSILVKERDEGDTSWVFARGDAEGDLDGLFVVAFAGDELEIVRLEGRIDRIMAEVLAEDPGEAAAMIRSAS